MEDLHKHADDRERLHRNHKSSRPLSKKYEYLGLRGEECIALRYGLPMDLTLKPGGDKGKDLTLPNGLVIDVKTARKAYHLLVEEGKVRADIFVLVQYYDEGDTCEALGWLYKQEVLDAPVRDVGRYGIMSHAVHAGDLRDMRNLDKLAEEIP